MPKVAVYTIALNEDKHVKRWFESAKEADVLLIADTGSKDKTAFLAKSLGISVFITTVVAMGNIFKSSGKNSSFFSNNSYDLKDLIKKVLKT